ncbi:MAG: hypothetical protein J6X18_13360 [Bacteroidales bacterium]|nr:hypothetical protein [Bacteroidales bacterium]
MWKVENYENTVFYEQSLRILFYLVSHISDFAPKDEEMLKETLIEVVLGDEYRIRIRVHYSNSKTRLRNVLKYDYIDIPVFDTISGKYEIGVNVDEGNFDEYRFLYNLLFVLPQLYVNPIIALDTKEEYEESYDKWYYHIRMTNSDPYECKQTEPLSETQVRLISSEAI